MTLATVKSAAKEASAVADILTRYLLVAGGSSATPDDTRAYLERAFFAWPMLCRAMAELERAAPNSAAAGMGDNAALREVATSAISARRGSEREAA